MLKNKERTMLGRLTVSELQGVIEHIGNTPIIPVIIHFGRMLKIVHLKLEGANPCGSLKDRTAVALVEDLEAKGLLSQGSTLVESSSGNLGAALALVGRSKGYHVRVVVDPKATQENLAKMANLGAEIDMVTQADEVGGYLLTRLKRVREILASDPNARWPNQYSNAANPRAHYLGTGPEIFRQMGGKVGAVFAPVSTGGTLAGIGRYFREVSPATKVIGVDAVGSIVFDGQPKARLLTGIGSSRRSDYITPELYDGHALVADQEAFSWCRALFAATGIQVGGSSGAALAACVRYQFLNPKIEDVVCICPDHGTNYENTIFNDSWLLGHGLVASRDGLAPAVGVSIPDVTILG